MSFTLTPARLFGPTAPGTSNTSLYTAPNAVVIKQILLTNTSGSAATITLNLVPNGGSLQTSNQILGGVLLMPNQVFTLDLSQVLATGDTIQGLQGTVGAINVTVSGTSITTP